MADAESGSAERPDEGSPPRDPTVTRRLRVLPRSYWLLLAIFVVLQVADVLTTNSALAIAGNWEANPIMASYQAQWGAAWWLPKAAGVGWICVVGPLVRRWWPMILAVSYSFVVVAGNLAAL